MTTDSGIFIIHGIVGVALKDVTAIEEPTAQRNSLMLHLNGTILPIDNPSKHLCQEIREEWQQAKSSIQNPKSSIQ